MKKNAIVLAAGLMLLASCGTYEGYGAVNGAYFGSLLGSAIGGISGGPRGSDVGTIIGMAGGAVAGAAIGSAADKSRQDDMAQYRQEKERLAAKRSSRSNDSYNSYNSYNNNQYSTDDSGFDSTNSADDRIDIDFGTPSNPEERTGCETASLEIRNARFVTPDKSNTLTTGKQCDIVFEIYNAGNGVAYNVDPVVKEVTGNKRIMISPGIQVERLGAHKGLRYTAHVMSYKTLKDGTARFSLSVTADNKQATQPIMLSVKTAR